METTQFYPITNDFIAYHNVSDNFITGYNPPYHRHDAYEIYLFLSGNVRLYVEQSCYQLEAGDLVIVSPDELHRSAILDDSPYDRIIVNIKKTMFERLSTPETDLLQCFKSHPHGKNNMIHPDSVQLSVFTNLATKLVEVSQSNQYASDILCVSYLMQLLAELNSIYSSSTIRNDDNLMPELVRKTMSFIKQHICETITLEMLSEEFHFNGDYLSSIFKKHTGLTIRSYILDQRIELAKNHLLHGKNVSEACLLSGFNDYSNFIRSFTKVTGVSPGRYSEKSLTEHM